MECAVIGCERPADRPGASRGFCIAHYHRYVRYGDPTFVPARPTRPIEDRFWEKVERGDRCWLWRGAIVRGYGVFYRGPKDTVPAHRMSYELVVGPIPDGLHIDHLCRVRHCVNPDHLEPVTIGENNRRAGAAVTHCPHGHEYTLENTAIWADGQRRCLICKRASDRRRYARSKR